MTLFSPPEFRFLFTAVFLPDGYLADETGCARSLDIESTFCPARSVTKMFCREIIEGMRKSGTSPSE